MITKKIFKMKIPFYQDGTYKVAIDLLSQQKESIAETQLDSLIFDTYIQLLSEMEIDESMFDEYLNNNKKELITERLKEIKQKTIQTHNADIFEYLSPSISYINNPIEEETKTKTYKQTKYVLNRNNPFAEIDLENKTYLYPNKKGAYKFLSANMTYVMTEQNEMLWLKPEYNINVTNKPKTDLITTDETITVKIKSKYDDRAIYYI